MCCVGRGKNQAICFVGRQVGRRSSNVQGPRSPDQASKEKQVEEKKNGSGSSLVVLSWFFSLFLSLFDQDDIDVDVGQDIGVGIDSPSRMLLVRSSGSGGSSGRKTNVSPR